MKNDQTSMVSGVSNQPYDELLEELKNALDRAFDIVYSTVPHKHSFSKPYSNSEFNKNNNMQKYESTFNEVDEIKSDNSNQKMTIENSMVDNKNVEINKYTNIGSNTETTTEYKEKFDQESSICYDSRIPDSIYSHELISEIIMELLNETSKLTQNQLEHLQKSVEEKKIYANRIMSILPETKLKKESYKLNENKSISADTIKCDHFNPYTSNGLQRRYSLPAQLNQLKITFNSSSRKINNSKKVSGLMCTTTFDSLYISLNFL